MTATHLHWLVPVLLLVFSPLIRKGAASLLRSLSRWSKWQPVIETSDRLSWVVFPILLQFALQNVHVSLPVPLWRGLAGLIHISYVVILVGWLRSFAYAGLEWTVSQRGSSQVLGSGFVPLIRNSITLVAMALGLILVLQHFGFDVMGLVTALGVGSLAVGLAAKDTLSNMISGFTLILDQNFKPGDRVAIGDCTGTVEEIGLRSTRIRTQAGSSWIVPNAELANTKLHNLGPGCLFIAVTLAMLAPGGAALAYSVQDHEHLTHSAFEAIRPCLDGEVPSSVRREVIHYNSWEDRNLGNKWFRFSHFYHPHHEGSGSGLFRNNSRARVLQLAQRLESTRDTHRWIGYLLHHIQDMTVPMHVLPVNHFWTDGFEKFKARHPEELAFDSCEALIETALQTTPDQLHQSVAEETLRSARSGYLTASAPSRIKIPLGWFWKEGSSGKFGGYGVLGNSFGISWLSALGRDLRISQHEYSRYKRERLASAERATQLILARAWLLGALAAAH